MFDRVTVCKVTKFVTQVCMLANGAIPKASAGKGNISEEKKPADSSGYQTNLKHEAFTAAICPCLDG